MTSYTVTLTQHRAGNFLECSAIEAGKKDACEIAACHNADLPLPPELP